MYHHHHPPKKGLKKYQARYVKFYLKTNTSYKYFTNVRVHMRFFEVKHSYSEMS